MAPIAYFLLPTAYCLYKALHGSYRVAAGATPSPLFYL